MVLDQNDESFSGFRREGDNQIISKEQMLSRIKAIRPELINDSCLPGHRQTQRFSIASNGDGTDSASDAIYMISPTKAVLISTSSVAPEVVIIQQ